MSGFDDLKSMSPGRPASVPSAQEILRRDKRPVSDFMEIESRRYLGSDDIPFYRYTSPQFFDLEMDRMWPRVWQWACREEQIPEPGDYYVYEIGRRSALIVRTESGEIKGFVNSCLHRGTKLKSGHCEGFANDIRCPFHGWTWSLSGELKRVPYHWDAPHVTADRFALPEVAVGVWGGFIFINFDRLAPPLDDYLAPLPDHFAKFDMTKRYIALHIEKELHGNWKAAAEAFLESYHISETHPQLLEGTYDEGTQVDIFSETVSRFITLIGVASPHIGRKISEQEQLDRMPIGIRSQLQDETMLREGETARVVMARVLRNLISEKYHVDLSTFNDSDIIDNAQYSAFPNMIIKPQLSLPMAYRFRPLGHDVDRALFEVFVLPPIPDTGERPEPAKPIRLKEEDSFAIVPGFEPALAQVFDQDTGNVRAQQEGFYASRKAAETLLNYNEARIRLHHQTLDRYLQR